MSEAVTKARVLSDEYVKKCREDLLGWAYVDTNTENLPVFVFPSPIAAAEFVALAQAAQTYAELNGSGTAASFMKSSLNEEFLDIASHQCKLQNISMEEVDFSLSRLHKKHIRHGVFHAGRNRGPSSGQRSLIEPISLVFQWMERRSTRNAIFSAAKNSVLVKREWLTWGHERLAMHSWEMRWNARDYLTFGHIYKFLPSFTKKHGPFIWLFDGFAVVGSTNGMKVSRSNVSGDSLIHKSNGPAIRFLDGRGIHIIQNMIVDPKYFPISKCSPEMILSERNAEIRRSLIDEYGAENLVRKGNARLINESKFGKLWRISLERDENIQMVEVVNSSPEPDGSYNVYFLRVPPYLNTSRSAVAWTFGEREDTYEPVLET